MHTVADRYWCHGIEGIQLIELTLEVESNVLWVEVAVLLHLQASVLEDGDVVSPSRVGYVDRRPRASKTRQ